MPERLKKGWTRVAFGDVVDRVESSGVPSAEESQTYIGLEHLESGSFTVSRWGSHVALVVPKTRVKKGDVLFARRNTHLRRCALAPFDCYFSPDGYAFRSKSPRLLQDLLLYIVASDPFMNFAIEHSAGTHSKRVKWEDLVRYEFALPPLEEQRRIAEVLGASARCRDYLCHAQDRLQKMKQSTEVELIAKPLGLSAGSLNLKDSRPAHGWMVCNGQELLDKGYLLALQDGNHGSQYPRSSELGDEGLPYIAASDISDEGDINLGACRRIRPERAAQLRIPPARSGDVILTNNATVGRVTRLPEWPTDIVASTSTTYYRCSEAVLDPDYLRWFFESSVFQFQLATIMRQSTRNQVPITTQKKLLFAVPQPDRQKALAVHRARFLSARGALRDQIARISQLQKTLLEANL